ncbi:HECT-type E3 ubiquitin transferase [Ascochyta rabiei]|uniref:HECT-type E3 ubiquitin transferase n=1 Tax=Didymella rabiei TaxID=5454 RepID=A0A163B0B5_DIDRA|nr:HECT-type E3 ubiquitin transferase [Ascochyta rabiei]KZM21499.1 ligase [Ascochyta rabiei]UPX15853.1 HECT-type E3 ubiquitin transferase [Ascochyta rabiei]
MKIRKQATARHESTLSPMIAEFVRATESIPLYQLPAHLASFPKQWPFPRGDAYHWIPVLNRFDRILELFNQEYGLVEGPQTQPFQRRLLLKGDAEEGNSSTSAEAGTTDAVLETLHISQDGDRELVEQLLSFTRMLLENCGNRSLYSSSERLDKLLNTTSTSLLRATLRLGHRLSQRYQAARLRLAPASMHPSLLSSHYNIGLDKIQKLSAPFSKGPAAATPLFGTPAGKGKDKVSGDRRNEADRFNPADLTGLYKLPESALKQEFGGVSISYYEPTAPPEESNDNPSAPSTDAPSTPTPVRRTSNMRNQTPRTPQTAPTVESPSTPAFTPGEPAGRPSGPKIFELSADKVEKTDIHDLLKQGLAELPTGTHFELLHKLRVAKMLSSGSAGRDDAIAVRLLAIANMGFVHSEKEFHARLGQQDADEPRRLQLAFQLSELVQPPGDGLSGLSTELQTFTFNALEALAKHKTKSADVCTALSVNVNHGVLFYIVRKLVAGLDATDGQQIDFVEDEWRDAVFSLLNTIPQSQSRTGEGMVSAGLLEILVEVLKLRTDKAERNHPKILNFLDTFVYNLQHAFAALVGARGLEIIADLMQYEVVTSKKLAEENKGMPKEYKTQLTDYQIPFYHQQTLRWLFKFLNHMMSHTGGNFDRLMRQLIDSSQLLTALRTVLSNASIFGSTVWSMAVNVLTSFIHNEPTSYQVIAEAGLSDAFLETVAGEPASEATAAAIASLSDTATPRPQHAYTPREPGQSLATGILPVAEAISTLPPAFGAICLAEAGMKLFQSSNALQRFFEIFESPAHVKALDADTEMPTMIGNTFDELVRHHPPLKARVLSCLSELIARVVQLCANKAEKEGAGAKLWTEDSDGKLFVAGGRRALVGSQSVHDRAEQTNSRVTDVEMEDSDKQTTSQTSGEVVSIDQIVDMEDSTQGPTTSQYIRVLCRFLGGFFSNHAMCAAYIEADGVESILDISSLACLDPKAKESRSMSEEFGRVVQVLVEQKPHITVPSLIKRTQRALDQLEPLLSHSNGSGFFAPFTSNTSQDSEVVKNGTHYVKSLVSAHTLVSAMTLTFQSQMFSPRSQHNVSAQVNLADMYARLVDSLGKLHRSCVWEEILLQRNMPTAWEKETRIISPGFGVAEADHIFGMGSSNRSSEPTEGATSEDTTPSQDTASAIPIPSQNSAQFKNTQTLRSLLSRIPLEIAPFFQSLGRLLLSRRNLEPYQRQCATIVSDQLAQAVIDQLQFEAPKESGSVEDRYAYWIVTLTSLSQLMIDPHMERTQALTLLLVSFRNLGGFEVLADVLNKFYESASDASRKEGDDASEESKRLLHLSLGGIKIMLAFYAQIINNKTISESPQTSSMQSRPDRDRDRADYFSTAQFLVELRYAVIKPVEKIWNSDLIDKATTSIVKTSINILKSVLECEGEHGASKSVDKIPRRSKPIIKPWTPRNGEHMNRLKEAEFDEGLAEEALYRCCDNYPLALDYCQNQTRQQSSKNPIPQYEIEARGPPSASPSRAEVVVPEHADNASISTGEDTNDESTSEVPDTRSVQMEDVAAADASQDMSDATPSTPVPDGQPTQTFVAPHDALAYQKRMAVGNKAEAVALDDLDQERVMLRQNLVDRSLDILNSHDGVTFELAELITAAVAKASDTTAMRSEIGVTLVQSLISYQSEEDFRSQGKKIAASAHLLALVLQEKDFYEVIVEELKDNFATLLGFIKIFPDQTPEESSPWIGQVLLIIERLLAEDQLPRQIQWTPPTAESQTETSVDDLPEPIISTDEKNLLFQAIMDVLPRIGKDESLALSVTRVLVMLTRTRKIATRLAEKRNIQRIFLMVKQLAGVTNEGLRSAFMIVLRHMIEDDAMIRQLMRTEIQQIFETRERRQTDTTAYTRQMYALAIRAPEIFVEVTNEKLQLTRFDPNQRSQTLTLKREEIPVVDTSVNAGPSDITAEADRPKESSELSTQKPTLERTKTTDLKLPVVENPDGVIHYLLCELLAYKEIEDKTEPPKPTESTTEISGTPEDAGDVQATPEGASTPSTTAAETNKPEKPAFKADAHPIYIYRCFVLKCLAELLQSYNRTKIEFINFSRKADPYTMTPSKPRSGVLNYLLSNLVPIGTLNHEGDLAFKKKLATSNCAVDVIVSLCNKTGENALPKTEANQLSPYAETEPDLLFVRKFVLEHALKAFKDANASDEALDIKYSRLLGIADTFSRMVSQRANGEMLTQNADLTPNLKQMAKIMYEKNFITILTTAISDIDLNFPNAKRVVKYILKPLKWLCYVAMDLSTHYDDSSAPDSADESEISTASDDDLVDNAREETPDLFRNSTLGLFEAHDNSESEDDEEEDDEEMMYDDPYADDMEFDEGGELGDDDVVSEEDEEMLEMDIDDMGPIEGLPGDVDVEIELDDGHEGLDSGTDDDSEEDEDDEDDEDMDEDDDDDDEVMDDEAAMEAMDELVEEFEEVTGDDEGGSLADDQEDWSDEGDDFPPGMNGGNMPSNPLNDFILDPPQLLEQMRQGGDIEDFLGDEMGEDGDGDEEEEYDEDDIHYDPGMEDDEEGMPELGWGGNGWDEPVAPTSRHTHRLSPWMFPAGPGDRILVPAYRSHRPGASPRATDDGINPLLQRSSRSHGRDGPANGRGESDWVHAIEGRGPRAVNADSPVSFISNLLNAMSQGNPPQLQQHGGAIHLSFNNLPMGLPPPFDVGFHRNMVPPRPGNLSRSGREDPHSAVAFSKAYTSQRWQEEARILYGPAAIEKSQRVINSILKLVVPPAMEAAKKRQEEREAEAARKLKEEIERKEQKEREEREAREKEEKERQEREAAEAAEAASRATETVASDRANEQPATTSDSTLMEGIEADQTAPEAPTEPAEPVQRITTTLRGREYDITELGIDLEYLDALPEELREEVLLQQVAERRQEQRQQQAQQARQQQQQQQQQQSSGQAGQASDAAQAEEPTGLDEEFLAALPPEMRAELLQQEASDRRRREREENRRRHVADAGPVAPQAEEIDAASFFATLDPALRAAVLMDTDEETLRQLPPEISAEARAYGGDRRLNQFEFGYQRGGRRGQLDDASQKKKARPCVQMLDKAGVATLLRLMFIPQQGSAKSSLSAILRYVCENRQNRAEVISILLSILQDGSADVNAVERSFAQLSLRAKQPQLPADKTPKLSRKNGALSINSDVSPLMVVQQCLNTLAQLTEKNPAVWQFFLTEHETGVGFKNRGNRKGKGKDAKSTRYPVNALLTLLDRKLIVESSSIMEQLTNLLRIITIPLQQIKKDKEKAAEEAKKAAETAAAGESPKIPATGSEQANSGSTDQPSGQDTGASAIADTAASTATATQSEDNPMKPEEARAEEEKGKKHKTITPPDIPENNLRLVAKILAARECNSKVFQETLSVISNLSPIPGAKEIFGQELLGIAKDLATSILDDLASLTAQVSKAESHTDVQGIALAKFSPATSDQTKLLRALTALDYLFDPSRDNKDKPEANAEALEPKQKEDILLTLYEDAAFAPLWTKLSDCLTVIRERGNMLNIATTLLPLIESLMVVCKNTTLKELPLAKMLPKEFALTSPPPESKMENLFFKFTEDHRKILNDLVRQNPKLMSGTFSLLVKNSKVLEFDNKRNYFNRKLHSRGSDRQPHPPLQLSVRRDQVFLDSFKSLYFKTAEEMKYGKLSIRFHGEEGVDAGGVTREWFQVIARQMFNADYALFVPVASDRTTFHPNRLSSINPEHLMFFKFIGRIIGKALYENRVLDCHFSRAVYKQIMSKQVNLKDMETLDLEYYKSLEWMLHNDITDIITETFSTEVEAFGEMQTVDLIEDGRNIPVTEENKHEYIRLITEYRLTGAVQEQLQEFLRGFHDIVPAELVSIFSEQELELLISGLPDINVDDWKNNTEYHNYTAASPQIQWFWRAVRTFEKEEQAKLLQFVTGTSKVPLNGFKELEGMNGFSKFNIHRDYGSKDRLPSSHTCFNQLDLPEYESYEDLRKALYTAMTAGGEYFGFA